VEHSFAPHMHDFYAVSLNYRGRGAFDCRREVHEATPGTCNLIAPGELHTGRATCGDGWIYRNLHIEPALMVRLLHSTEWRGPSDVSFKASLVKDTVLAARLARVFASMTESGSLLENESLLLSVVARLITDRFVHGHALGAAGREHVAVTRVKEWLDANSEQKTIEPDTHLQEPTSLDSDVTTFRDDLRHASDAVVRLHERLARTRVTPNKRRNEIASLFDEALPEESQPMAAILHDVEEHIFANSTLYSNPRFFGYINGSVNQAAVVGELLAAAVNQICAKWQFSQAASEVERRVIQWIAEFVGYGSDAGGCLLNGGSAGNFAGLAVARQQKAPFDANTSAQWGGPPLTVYVSREGHASIDKSMALLGMGRGQLRRIAVRTTSPSISRRLRSRSRQTGRTGITRSAWWAMPAPSIRGPWIRLRPWRTSAGHRGCGFTWTRPMGAGGANPAAKRAPRHFSHRRGLSAGRDRRDERRGDRLQGLRSTALEELPRAESVDHIQGVRSTETASRDREQHRGDAISGGSN
jgi:hypothetical protein